MQLYWLFVQELDETSSISCSCHWLFVQELDGSALANYGYAICYCRERLSRHIWRSCQDFKMAEQEVQEAEQKLANLLTELQKVKTAKIAADVRS